MTEPIEIGENLDPMHKVVCGSNLEVLPRLSRNSVDLVLTSPPYAQQRKRNYQGVSEEEYPEFTLRWCEACDRVLKPTGSIMIVIRSHMKGGSVSPYVLRTRVYLQDNGWFECGEIIWSKPGSIPVGRNDRPRQEHEQVLWLSKNPKLAYCDPKANGVPSTRMAELTGKHGGSGKGFDSGQPARPKDRVRKGVAQGRIHEAPDLKPQVPGIARSTDGIKVRPAGCNKATYNTHPAQGPPALYRHLIKLASPPGGMVLENFAGSGTTMEACYHEGRESYSIDTEAEYVSIIRRRHLDLVRDFPVPVPAVVVV